MKSSCWVFVHSSLLAQLKPMITEIFCFGHKRTNILTIEYFATVYDTAEYLLLPRLNVIATFLSFCFFLFVTGYSTNLKTIRFSSLLAKRETKVVVRNTLAAVLSLK